MINAAKLNTEFPKDLGELEGCETVLGCFRCGACSAACPVSKVVEDFDPRRIVHMVGLGLEDYLLNSDIIWACSQCQSCIPVCPQGVRPADVIKALRRKALEKRVVNEDKLKALGLIAEVDPGKCVACLTCVRLCPFAAPHIVSEGYAYIEPELCHGCGICVLECPAEAIHLSASLEQKGAGHPFSIEKREERSSKEVLK